MPNIRNAPAVVRENLPLVVITLVWAASWLAVSSVMHLPEVTNRGVLSYLSQLLVYFVTGLLPVLTLLVLLGHLLSGGRAADFLSRGFWAGLAGRYVNGRVLGGLILVLVCLPVFYATFRNWKTAIPALIPFYLDPGLEAAERWLHGGRHPWEWQHGLFGRPGLTYAIDSLYVFWFEAKLAVVLWMAFTRRRWLRARFFIAYLLLYVLLGHVAATLFSSAGPVYFAQVVPDAVDPFAPLMAYLHELNETHPVFAVGLQAQLWGGYVGTYDGPVTGISAFPSIHVAVATLYMLLGFSVNRALGWVAALFLAITMLGSVHLGWHYALDGYVSMLAVTGLWLWSGRLTATMFRRLELDTLDDPAAPPEFRVRAVRPTHAEEPAAVAVASAPEPDRRAP